MRLLRLLIPLWIHAVAVCLFAASYFTYYNESDTLVEEDAYGARDIGDSYRPHPAYGRVVVVLVDALRANMALEGNMPFVQEIVAKNQALAYVARTQAPTVTMPRLKALSSGTVPKFADALFNFGSSEMRTPNIIASLRSVGKRIVLLGDDTWIKLFPGMFVRQDGTSSFFTKDTVEVDLNVSRHIDSTFDPKCEHKDSTDWDVVILHYLGLDHIGHQVGPAHPMMREKQLEMDSVFRRIHGNIVAQDKARERKEGESFLPTLLVLCSDHGMTVGGNHGGNSDDETAAVFVFTSSAFKGRSQVSAESSRRRFLEDISEVQQIDFSTSLAMLTGAPVPAQSIGVVLSDLFEDSRDRLMAMARNAAHLCRMLSRDDEKEAQFKETCDTVRAIWVRIDDTNFDAITSEVALGRCLATLQAALLDRRREEIHMPGILVAVATLAGTVVLFVYCGLSLSASPYSCNLTRRRIGEEALFVVGGIVAILSQTGSSFVENEHVVWYFYLTTWLIRRAVLTLRRWYDARSSSCATERMYIFALQLAAILAVRIMRNRNEIINFSRMNELPSPTLLASSSVVHSSTSVMFDGADHRLSFWILRLFGLVFAARFVKQSWNSRQIKKGAMHRILGATGTALIVGGSLLCSRCKQTRIVRDHEGSTTLDGVSGGCSNDQVSLVLVCSAALIALGILELVPLLLASTSSRSSHTQAATLHVRCGLLLLLVTLHRSHNILSLACLSFICFVVNSSEATTNDAENVRLNKDNMKTEDSIESGYHRKDQQRIPGDIVLCTFDRARRPLASGRSCSPCCMIERGIVVYALGKCGFFALGNSHLISTVDVAGAFAGATEFSPLVPIFLWIVTYSGQILTTLVLCCGHGASYSSPVVLFAIAATSGTGILTSSLVLLAMRHHLFVWSVFAPRFCYEAVSSLTYVALLSVIIGIRRFAGAGDALG